MRLWLNRTGEISLREQLRTQVVLGILCQELVPGARLPSTRELARRFGIHANTASAAYRELESEGWLEFRAGSGVYVQASRPAAPESPALAAEFAVDQLIGELVVKARKRLFGSWEMNWIAYNFASDIALPGEVGATLPFLMYTQGETGGTKIDPYDQEHFVYEITAKEISA